MSGLANNSFKVSSPTLLLTYLQWLSLSSLWGVFYLSTGVEAGEGCEGVDPWPAGPRKSSHEAADAAQWGEDVGWERLVHQQVWDQVPGLVYHRQIHAISTNCTLSTHIAHITTSIECKMMTVLHKEAAINPTLICLWDLYCLLVVI